MLEKIFKIFPNVFHQIKDRRQILWDKLPKKQEIKWYSKFFELRIASLSIELYLNFINFTIKFCASVLIEKMILYFIRCALKKLILMFNPYLRGCYCHWGVILYLGKLFNHICNHELCVLVRVHIQKSATEWVNERVMSG